MRIAIVGGSFDPIHDGHIQMANQSLQGLGVDEVWFMPTSSTPLKDHDLTLDQERLAMIDLVVKKNQKFKVCTLELERAGKSYTYDTLKKLIETYPVTSARSRQASGPKTCVANAPSLVCP